MGPVTLADDHLVLRTPDLDDVEVITAACQDPLIQHWTTIPSPYTALDAIFYVNQVARDGWAQGTAATWLVTDRSDGTLLGSCGLHNIADGMAELGYWTAAHARGRGVTTGAARLVCAWGFAELGLARIEWQAHLGNDASRRVAERLGFTIEGVTRQRMVQRGVRRDGWIGALLPGELLGGEPAAHD